jgi:hypothetical protein
MAALLDHEEEGVPVCSPTHGLNGTQVVADRNDLRLLNKALVIEIITSTATITTRTVLSLSSFAYIFPPAAAAYRGVLHNAQ